MCKKCLELWSKELVHIEKTVREFRDLYEIWNTERDAVVSFLDIKASKLDGTKRRFNFLKISGAGAGLVGGVLTVTGLVLTPFTLGASNVLTFTGLGIGVAAGATTAGGAFAEMGINSSEKKKVLEMLESHKIRTQKLSELIDELSKAQKDLEQLTDIKCAQFKWTDVASLLKELTAAGAVTRDVATFVTESIRLSKGGFNIFLASGGETLLANVPMASTIIPILTSVTGQSVIAGIGMVFSLFSIGFTARDLHRGSKSDIATELRSKADTLNEERDEIFKKFRFFLDPTYTAASLAHDEGPSIDPCSLFNQMQVYETGEELTSNDFVLVPATSISSLTGSTSTTQTIETPSSTDNPNLQLAKILDTNSQVPTDFNPTNTTTIS